MAGIKLSKDQYTNLLKQLLPEGPAWATEDGSNLIKLLSAFAEELKRAHDTANVLISESNPLTLNVTLASREKEAGLPDACVPLGSTAVERKNAVIAKWASRGGQSRQFLIDIAASFGFTTTITEFRPFTAGSVAGDSLTNGDDWAYTFQVNAPQDPTTSTFQSGISVAGDPLRTTGNELLQCVINKNKPARTIAIFVET